MVGKQDEFINRHIAKLDLFAPILKLLGSIGNKDSLLNSSILDLFEYIRHVRNWRISHSYAGRKPLIA